MFSRPGGDTPALACLAVQERSSFKFGVRHDKVRFESLGIYSVIHELQVSSVSLLPQPTIPLSISPFSACPSGSMVDFQDPTVIAQDYCAYYMFSDLAPSRWPGKLIGPLL